MEFTYSWLDVFKPSEQLLALLCEMWSFLSVYYLRRELNTLTLSVPYIILQCVNLLKPTVTLHITMFKIQKFCIVITLHLCVLYGSQNKQQLLPYAALTDWFL